MQISGQGNLGYVLSSKLTESDTSSFESAVFHSHSKEIDNLLISCGSVTDVPAVLNKVRLSTAFAQKIEPKRVSCAAFSEVGAHTQSCNGNQTSIVAACDFPRCSAIW